VEVCLHSILTSALDESNCSASCLVALPPGEGTLGNCESGRIPQLSGCVGQEKIPVMHLCQFMIHIHTDIPSSVAYEFYKLYLNKPGTNYSDDISTLQFNLMLFAYLCDLHLSTWHTDILSVELAEMVQLRIYCGMITYFRPTRE
jgi:hypothetical protein